MSVKTGARSSSLGDLWDFVKVVIQALAIALVVRVFLFQPFNIPSASMVGTLLVGDYLFVSKYSYGFTKYSFYPIPESYIPITGRFWSGNPTRGDVAVFRKPSDTKIDYIKRVIGLPGEKIQIVDGAIYIDGKAVPRRRIEDFVEVDAFGNSHNVPQFEETLPNGITYKVLDRNPHGEFDNTTVYVVPPGHYFMMGDNRDNSSDSRDPSGGVGYVPLENFIGRATIIFFSGNERCSFLTPWDWPSTIRWGRFFKLVH